MKMSKDDKESIIYDFIKKIKYLLKIIEPDNKKKIINFWNTLSLYGEFK